MKILILAVMTRIADVIKEITGKTKCNTPILTDTIKWFNITYVLNTAINCGDVDNIGGFSRTIRGIYCARKLLRDYWHITDRASADKTLYWILYEGHRAEFMEIIETMWELSEDGILELSKEDAAALLKDMDFDDEDIVCFTAMLQAYQIFGEHAVDAWDFCRAFMLLGWYYVVGFYTMQEKLDHSLEIAKELQQFYHSWDELVESYLIGVNYYYKDDAQDPESNTAARYMIYEELKSDPDGPYSLDWNTTLEKTW